MVDEELNSKILVNLPVTNACVLGMPRLLCDSIALLAVQVDGRVKYVTAERQGTDYLCTVDRFAARSCKRAVSELLQCCSGCCSWCKVHRLCRGARDGRCWLLWEVPTLANLNTRFFKYVKKPVTCLNRFLFSINCSPVCLLKELLHIFV